nr:SpoIIE family protein phosphatase [Motilibacter aurantiacus]
MQRDEEAAPPAGSPPVPASEAPLPAGEPGVPAGSAGPALADVLDALAVATIVLDARGRIAVCNSAAAELLQLPAGRWAGRSVLLGQDDSLVDAVRRLLAGEPMARETPVRLGNGDVRALSWKGTPLRDADGAPAGAVAVLEDTRRRQATRRDLALVDALFREAPVGLAVFDTRGRFTRVNRALELLDGVPDDEHRGQRFTQALPTVAADVDEVVDRVLRTGAPAPDVEIVTSGDSGGSGADPGGARTWLGSFFRLEHAGQPVGVGSIIRDVTSQRRAQQERAEAAERLAFIVRAGELLAGSLDPRLTMSNLCDLIVPALADHAFVDLREEDGGLRRTAIRHAEGVDVPPAAVRHVGQVYDYPHGHPLRRAAELGEEHLVPDVDAVPQQVPQGKDAGFVKAVGGRSVLVLPMMVAGQVIGVTTMVLSRSGRRYGPAEAELARDLVNRASVAVANALSYEQQRSAAVALQRSLLPEVLTGTEGLDAAWRYLPGATGTQVGGDWADVIPLPSGRVAIVVGDVMGRGLHAAAVMGQVRTAVRVLAYQDPPPSEVLRALDLAVAGLAEGQIVTCVYAVFDPGRGTLTLASAGHVPPILVPPGGEPEVLRGPVGVPLGVRADLGYEDFEVPMPHGTGLALYTDGLVEAPGQDVDDGIARLAEALRDGWDDLDGLCDAAIKAGAQHAPGRPDDVAVLLVRASFGQDELVVSATLPPDPAAVSPARAMFSAALERWGLGDDPAAIAGELLVSEVVTNAIRYAPRGSCQLLVRRAERSLHIEVRDSDTRLPRLRHASFEDEGGRGLALVQALSRNWGARALPDGKVVWFTLDVPPVEPPAG